MLQEREKRLLQMEEREVQFKAVVNELTTRIRTVDDRAQRKERQADMAQREVEQLQALLVRCSGSVNQLIEAN